eukprot:3791836-Amphidinium_carterae.1
MEVALHTASRPHAYLCVSVSVERLTYSEGRTHKPPKRWTPSPKLTYLRRLDLDHLHVGDMKVVIV